MVPANSLKEAEFNLSFMPAFAGIEHISSFRPLSFFKSTPTAQDSLLTLRQSVVNVDHHDHNRPSTTAAHAQLTLNDALSASDCDSFALDFSKSNFAGLTGKLALQAAALPILEQKRLMGHVYLSIVVELLDNCKQLVSKPVRKRLLELAYSCFQYLGPEGLDLDIDIRLLMLTAIVKVQGHPETALLFLNSCSEEQYADVLGVLAYEAVFPMSKAASLASTYLDESLHQVDSSSITGNVQLFSEVNATVEAEFALLKDDWKSQREQIFNRKWIECKTKFVYLWDSARSNAQVPASVKPARLFEAIAALCIEFRMFHFTWELFENEAAMKTDWKCLVAISHVCREGAKSNGVDTPVWHARFWALYSHVLKISNSIFSEENYTQLMTNFIHSCNETLDDVSNLVVMTKLCNDMLVFCSRNFFPLTDVNLAPLVDLCFRTLNVRSNSLAWRQAVKTVFIELT